MSETHPIFNGVLTTGEHYTGNQQYRGNGVLRWCAICGSHKPQLGGTIQHVLGGRQWVCVKHPKKVVANA